MKTIILTAAVLIVYINAYAQNNFYPNLVQFNRLPEQDLTFEVHGNYDRAVNKTLLENARLINDFVDGYPVNWIDKYESVEILTIKNGIAKRAVSANDKLTTEQISILKGADISSEIIVNVKYQSVNTLANADKVMNINNLMRQLHFKMTVIPQTQAEYFGGQIQMSTYLTDYIINKIPKEIANKIDRAQVTFTISEVGKVENAKINKTSGDAKTDELIVDALTKMPNWKPAENSKRIKVKQDFKFTVGMFGC